jgi:hypothetical protein
MSRGLGGGGEPYITHDGSDVIFDPRAVDAAGTVVFAASTAAEPHLRLLTGVNHTTSLVAGDLWFDGTNFKGYDGTSSLALDVQAASGGGFTDDGTRVRLTTATDHLAIGTVTPVLTGSGDLTVAGNFDFEGYGAVGNGSAAAVDITLIIDRDFSTASAGKGFVVQGIMTVTGGTSDLDFGVFDPGGVVINSGNVHLQVSSGRITEPNITLTSGTVTTAVSFYIKDAPTEGTNNYALFVDAGATRLDGDLEHLGTNLGFHGTTPIAQQTGVAVSAAGIHAACVAIGLFTA